MKKQDQLREITTSCNIVKPLIGFYYQGYDTGVSPVNLELNLKVEIEWIKLGDGGICKLWLIKATGEKVLFDRWSSTDNLKLIQYVSATESGSTSITYMLTDDVFTFFHVVSIDEMAYAKIQTQELLP